MCINSLLLARQTSGEIFPSCRASAARTQNKNAMQQALIDPCSDFHPQGILCLEWMTILSIFLLSSVPWRFYFRLFSWRILEDINVYFAYNNHKRQSFFDVSLFLLLLRCLPLASQKALKEVKMSLFIFRELLSSEILEFDLVLSLSLNEEFFGLLPAPQRVLRIIFLCGDFEGWKYFGKV